MTYGDISKVGRIAEVTRQSRTGDEGDEMFPQASRRVEGA